jgi:hypothetical protein
MVDILRIAGTHGQGGVDPGHIVMSRAEAAAKKLFADRVQRIQLEWLAQPGGSNYGTSYDREILQRLCSDERMGRAWELLNKLSEDDFSGLIEVLLDTHRGAVLLATTYRNNISGMLSDIAAGRRMLHTFYDFCTSWKLSTDGNAAIEEKFPDGLEWLAQVDDYLLEHQQWLTGQLDPSRKAASDGGRTEFTTDLATIIKVEFGKPLYEVVAALRNVIFGTGDKPGIAGDAVRAAVIRKNKDYSRGKIKRE